VSIHFYANEAVSGWRCLRRLAGDAAVVELADAIVPEELRH
jgi:hypothetical protein